MLKKIIPVISAIAVIASFTACGNNSGSSVSKEETAVEKPVSSSSNQETEVTSEEETEVTTVPDEDDSMEFPEKSETKVKDLSLVVGKFTPVNLNNRILYDNDGVKVVGKQIKVVDDRDTKEVKRLAIECEFINETDKEVYFSVDSFSINNEEVGSTDSWNHKNLPAKTTSKDTFTILVFDIVMESGYNVNDIRLMKFNIATMNDDPFVNTIIDRGDTIKVKIDEKGNAEVSGGQEGSSDATTTQAPDENFENNDRTTPVTDKNGDYVFNGKIKEQNLGNYVLYESDQIKITAKKIKMGKYQHELSDKSEDSINIECYAENKSDEELDFTFDGKANGEDIGFMTMVSDASKIKAGKSGNFTIFIPCTNLIGSTGFNIKDLRTITVKAYNVNMDLEDDEQPTEALEIKF